MVLFTRNQKYTKKAAADQMYAVFQRLLWIARPKLLPWC